MLISRTRAWIFFLGQEEMHDGSAANSMEHYRWPSDWRKPLRATGRLFHDPESTLPYLKHAGEWGERPCIVRQKCRWAWMLA